MDKKQMEELLYQALETEIGGQKVYETAIKCAQNSELKKEWKKYLEETTDHEQILRETSSRSGSTRRRQRLVARSCGSRAARSSSRWRWR